MNSLEEDIEHHLNMVLAELYPVIKGMFEEGVILPSMIAGLVQLAQQVARENAGIVGEDFFEACVTDILNGGDGLHVGPG